MNASHRPTWTKRVLIVYYSPAARERLEACLRAHPRVEVFSVNGRAPEAAEAVGKHPAEVVLVDQGAKEISVSQAVRHIGQMLPNSLVIAVPAPGQRVEAYQGRHHIGTAETLELALQQYAFAQDA